MTYQRKIIVSQPVIGSSAVPCLQVRCGLLHLEYWPDIPSLPEEMVEDAARLCALLSFRPTSPALAAYLLSISSGRIGQVIDSIAHGATGLETDFFESTELESLANLETSGSEGKSASILSKIWKRLRTKS